MPHYPFQHRTIIFLNHNLLRHPLFEVRIILKIKIYVNSIWPLRTKTCFSLVMVAGVGYGLFCGWKQWLSWDEKGVCEAVYIFHQIYLNIFPLKTHFFCKNCYIQAVFIEKKKIYTKNDTFWTQLFTCN